MAAVDCFSQRLLVQCWPVFHFTRRRKIARRWVLYHPPTQLCGPRNQARHVAIESHHCPFKDGVEAGKNTAMQAASLQDRVRALNTFAVSGKAGMATLAYLKSVSGNTHVADQ